MSAHRQDSLMTVISSVLIALALFGARHFLNQRPEHASPQSTGTHRVVRIIDGDTVDVSSGGVVQRLRLLGIDTPEKGQPFGNEARDALSSYIEGRNVRVAIRETDRYGRSIADIYDGDRHINAWLVESGLAWHYKSYSDDPALAAAEEDARDARRGLWSTQDPVPPWNWRKLSKVERDRYR